MHVILFGATGMVGSGVLQACLRDPRVGSVLVIGRSPAGVRDPKIDEILHSDFFDFTAIQGRLTGCDACFFCLGVSSAGMREEQYRRLTLDLTLAAARAVLAASPRAAFCYVSGAGTDGTERGRVMWARVKGRTENALLALPFRAAYMFRPGYIQPLEGVRSKTRLYRVLYSVVAPFYPVLRRLFPRFVTTSADLGRAMIQAAARGSPRRVLETDDINRLARSSSAPPAEPR